MAGTAARRSEEKQGAPRRFLIYALWTTFVHTKAFSRGGWWVGSYNKNIERATLLSSFLSSRQSFFSLLESRKSQLTEASPSATTVAHLLCRERKIGLYRTWPLRCRISNSLVIVVTVILENNFESPGKVLLSVIEVYFFFLNSSFLKHSSRRMSFNRIIVSKIHLSKIIYRRSCWIKKFKEIIDHFGKKCAVESSESVTSKSAARVLRNDSVSCTI